MTKIAIVYHSGYGHTEVLAQKVAEGASSVGAQADLHPIKGLTDDFAALVAALDDYDAIVFGTPTYMGDVSAPFKAFMDASSAAWFTAKWKDKLATAFTNSLSLSGDKLNTLISLSVFAAQHGMIWVSAGMAPGAASGKTGPEDVNRLGSALGTMAQSENVGPDVSPPTGDRETARLLGIRIGTATARWLKGA
jgi:NAD(P)H dehydrogenase (quinone)